MIDSILGCDLYKFDGNIELKINENLLISKLNMFATPQNQPQPAFGLGQQMITIDDKQFTQFHGDQLKQLIDFVNQFQWDINLQNLITVIRNEQERSIEIMEKICSVESKEQNMDTKAQKEQAEYIKERSAKIKKRNH